MNTFDIIIATAWISAIILTVNLLVHTYLDRLFTGNIDEEEPEQKQESPCTE